MMKVTVYYILLLMVALHVQTHLSEQTPNLPLLGSSTPYSVVDAPYCIENLHIWCLLGSPRVEGPSTSTCGCMVLQEISENCW